ncbi:MAG: GfdT protein, partial [Gemmatimonadetes bacterium]|nr:GfdT protein [Gemmatimonadota bacterium]
MNNAPSSRSAITAHLDPAEAARELVGQFGGMEPRAVFFFCSAAHDGAALGAALAA